MSDDRQVLTCLFCGLEKETRVVDYWVTLPPGWLCGTDDCRHPAHVCSEDHVRALRLAGELWREFESLVVRGEF